MGIEPVEDFSTIPFATRESKMWMVKPLFIQTHPHPSWKGCLAKQSKMICVFMLSWVNSLEIIYLVSNIKKRCDLGKQGAKRLKDDGLVSRVSKEISFSYSPCKASMNAIDHGGYDHIYLIFFKERFCHCVRLLRVDKRESIFLPSHIYSMEESCQLL